MTEDYPEKLHVCVCPFLKPWVIFAPSPEQGDIKKSQTSSAVHVASRIILPFPFHTFPHDGCTGPTSSHPLLQGLVRRHAGQLVSSFCLLDTASLAALL